MTYTRLKSNQQQQLINIKNAGKCFFIHLGGSWDGEGNFFPITSEAFPECSSCKDISKCRQLRQLVEEWMNGGDK